MLIVLVKHVHVCIGKCKSKTQSNTPKKLENEDRKES